MQDISLSFVSSRERRTADETLRDQLSYIAKRALAGNRGRGWDYEVGSIDVETSNRNGSLGYTLTGNIRFFRRVDVGQDRLARQVNEIAEWAGAAGHNARFGRRPWVMTPLRSEIIPRGIDNQEEEEDEDSHIREAEVIPLKEIGVIRRGKFFDHLYGLDAQIRVILSAIQPLPPRQG